MLYSEHIYIFVAIEVLLLFLHLHTTTLEIPKFIKVDDLDASLGIRWNVSEICIYLEF